MNMLSIFLSTLLLAGSFSSTIFGMQRFIIRPLTARIAPVIRAASTLKKKQNTTSDATAKKFFSKSKKTAAVVAVSLATTGTAAWQYKKYVEEKEKEEEQKEWKVYYEVRNILERIERCQKSCNSYKGREYYYRHREYPYRFSLSSFMSKLARKLFFTHLNVKDLKEKFLRESKFDQEDFLGHAIIKADIPVITAFLECGAQPNAEHLYQAIYTNRKDLVALLIDHKAEINDLTFRVWVYSGCNQDIFQLLTQSDLNKQRFERIKDSLLSQSVRPDDNDYKVDDYRVKKFLFDAGAQDPKGRHALCVFARQGDCQYLQKAIDHLEQPTTMQKVVQKLFGKKSYDYLKYAADSAFENEHWKALDLLNPTYFQEYIERQKQKISNASDLTQKQKDLFLRVCDQMNIRTIFCEKSSESLKALLPIANESLDKIIQYFPIALLSMENPENDVICNKEFSSTEKLAANLAFDKLRRLTINRFNGLGKDEGYDKDLVEKTRSIEKEFEDDGYQTFYHGRRWEWNFANDMWRILCALQDNASQLPDLIALRYRTGHEDSATLLSYRTDLIESGTSNYSGSSTKNASGKDAEIVCMNRTPLSNSLCEFICTGSYVVNNYNAASLGSAVHYIEKMFSDRNMDDLYFKYKHRIFRLAQMHKEANKQGELLCIAVRKNYLSDMVYVSRSFGRKRFDKTTLRTLEESKQRVKFDSSYIENDDFYFVFAVPDIPGEYNDKYMVKSLHNADPLKYAAYQRQLNELFDDMKKQCAAH